MIKHYLLDFGREPRAYGVVIEEESGDVSAWGGWEIERQITFITSHAEVRGDLLILYSGRHYIENAKTQKEIAEYIHSLNPWIKTPYFLLFVGHVSKIRYADTLKPISQEEDKKLKDRYRLSKYVLADGTTAPDAGSLSGWVKHED
jgi:hypothetical protein